MPQGRGEWKCRILRSLEVATECSQKRMEASAMGREAVLGGNDWIVLLDPVQVTCLGARAACWRVLVCMMCVSLNKNHSEQWSIP